MSRAQATTQHEPPLLGLSQNWRQFSLLVLVNAFVGGMVGLERAILPILAEDEFHLVSKSAILSFIISFGIVKALTNLVAGGAADRIGRKPLLIAGWLFGLPVPFLLMWAPTWNWVIVANVLLGINQGLCWSTTVLMKIDLVGPRRRGLAMGLNEFAGYVAIALAAFTSALLASRYGLRPVPFVLGVIFAGFGLLLSWLFVQDTGAHVRAEARGHGGEATAPPFFEVLMRTSIKNPNLSASSQAGLVNNLNDGVAWGLFPIFFASAGLDLRQIGMLTAIYPAVWGASQIATGALSDSWGRKWMIAAGMWVQAGALGLIAIAPRFAERFALWMMASVLLGAGTALVYPTLLAAIGDAADPVWRASAVGVYRLWRDLGYAIGAILSGIVADFLGVGPAIAMVAGLTFVSGMIVAARMSETRQKA